MQTLLVTVDSLRADHLGQYGYERETMPVLDRLVETGTLFENAFSNGSYTRISVPSFLASRYLAYEQLDRLPTVASVLSDAGAQTAVVGTQTGIGLVDGAFGFDETIDLGRDEFHETANNDKPVTRRVKEQIDRPAAAVSQALQRWGLDGVYDLLRRPYNAVVGGDVGFQYLGYTSAEAVTDRALSWVRSHADEDFFLWVHYMEAHRPYGVHDDDPAYLDAPVSEDRIKRLMRTAGTRPDSITESERSLMRDLYDSDVRYCSRHLERLFDGLEDHDVWEDANILFSSDHGEEFREHGHFFHRNYPYDVLTHVPLIVKSPASDGDARVSQQRELLDLAPTIRALHRPDGEAVPSFEGEHLFEGDARTVFSLGQPPEADPAVAVRTDGFKYVTDGTKERLYDVEADPGEQTDVADERPSVASRLRRTVPDELLAREAREPRAPENEVDRERLAALGYVEQRD